MTQEERITRGASPIPEPVWVRWHGLVQVAAGFATILLGHRAPSWTLKSALHRAKARTALESETRP